MFDAIAWMERCKTCFYSFVTTDEVQCKIKGECKYKPRTYKADENGQTQVGFQQYKCFDCGIVFRTGQMAKRIKDGKPYFKHCKECNKKYELRINKPKKPLIRVKRTEFPETSLCKRCQKEKPVSEFYVSDLKYFQLHSYCKTCECEIRKEKRRLKNGKATNE